MRNPDDPNSCKLLDEVNKYDFADVETTVDTFFSKVNVETEDENGDVQTTQYDYASLTVATTISMKNSRVVDTYTTKTGDSAGAISLTCQSGDKQIVIRTTVLKNAEGKVVTADLFANKTIDVRGIIDYYKYEENPGEYQIKVFNLDCITIH